MFTHCSFYWTMVEIDTFYNFFCVVFSVHIPYLLMVGLNRLELLTSRLSGVRSNQLSYRPIMVETRRIELLTPCLQGRCSPSWATPPLWYVFFFEGCSFKTRQCNVHPDERPELSSLFSLMFSLERRWSSRTFRYGYLVTTSPQSSPPP